MSKGASYVIVTPVRNEESRLPQTIDSVTCQTLGPKLWILVDDGSSDGTVSIAEAAAKKHPWIRLVCRADRGFRQPGTGVIEAFYDGYRQVEREAWDFLVKLDGDLSFNSDYFERSLEHFARNSKLGIGGGTVCRRLNDDWVVDSKGDPRFHVRGATKIYRRSCWEQIGGLIKAPGWDTVDEVKANMLGWETWTFAELKLNQHKDTGSADGAWQNWVKNGRANYVTGYHPLFMLLKCLRRLTERPLGIVAIGLGWGFVSGYFRRLPRLNEPAVIQYLRRQQLNRLLLRKSIWT